MLGFKNRPRWLGGNWPELDAEFIVEEIPDDHKSDEPSYFEILPAAGTLDDKALIEKLEAQLAVTCQMLTEQNEMLAITADVIIAARAFVDLITSNHAKSGEPMFKLNGEPDDPLSQTLAFRYSDLAAALNNIGRPVPPTLAQGTVH